MLTWQLHRRRAPRSLIGILLVALILRGLIPAGYMPGTGGAFGLELCNGGSLPAHHLTDDPNHHHGGSGPHFEHCVFGSAPVPGPAPDVVIALTPPEAVDAPVTADRTPLLGVTLARAQQARAPPLPV